MNIQVPNRRKKTMFQRKFGHDPSSYWALDCTRWRGSWSWSWLATYSEPQIQPKHVEYFVIFACTICPAPIEYCSRRGHSLSGTLAKAPWLLKPISKKSSHMQVENFTKSPESPYVKTKYKIHLKTTESQSVPMLRQNIKWSENDYVSEVSVCLNWSWKIISKRQSLRFGSITMG